MSGEAGVPMRRRIMAWWLGGPLCDFGTAHGQTGCLRLATSEGRLVSQFWTRPLRWCAKHAPGPGETQVDGWVGWQRREGRKP